MGKQAASRRSACKTFARLLNGFLDADWQRKPEALRGRQSAWRPTAGWIDELEECPEHNSPH